MSHLIKFLKDAHTFGSFANQVRVTTLIDDSPEMMGFTADEFCDVTDEKDLLETHLTESLTTELLMRAIVERGSDIIINGYIAQLREEAENNMKERITELLK